MKSKNLALLASLYDNTAQRLHVMIQAGKQPSDPTLKDQVVWLEQIARTIMAVYQIEKSRTQSDEMIPGEKHSPDPNPRNHPPQQGGLGGIPSPGSWSP